MEKKEYFCTSCKKFVKARSGLGIASIGLAGDVFPAMTCDECGSPVMEMSKEQKLPIKRFE